MKGAAPLLVICLAGAAGTAAAQGGPSMSNQLDLRWSAPPACPGAAAMRTRITQMSGDVALTKPLRVTGTVTLKDGQYSVLLETAHEGKRLSRELQGPSCKTVADAAALVVALVINPDAKLVAAPSASSAAPPAGATGTATGTTATTTPAPATAAPTATATGTPPVAPGETARSGAPQPRPTVAPAPLPRRPAPRPARPELPDRRPSGWFVAGHGVASALDLPGAGGGFDLRTGYSWGGITLGGELLLMPARRSEVIGQADKGGDVSMLGGALFGCYTAAADPAVMVRGCVGGELASMTGEGYGVDVPASGSFAWLAGRVFVGVGFPLTDSVSIETDVGGVFPFGRPRFLLQDIGEVHEPSAVAVRARVGMALYF